MNGAPTMDEEVDEDVITVDPEYAAKCVEMYKVWYQDGYCPDRATLVAWLETQWKSKGRPSDGWASLTEAQAKTLMFVFWDHTENGGTALNYETHLNFRKGLCESARQFLLCGTRHIAKVPSGRSVYMANYVGSSGRFGNHPECAPGLVEVSQMTKDELGAKLLTTVHGAVFRAMEGMTAKEAEAFVWQGTRLAARDRRDMTKVTTAAA